MLSDMVLHMTTSNKAIFEVAFAIPRVESVTRKAELITQENGYSFIRYSGERKFVKLNSETDADLLSLVPPFQEFPKEEKWQTDFTLGLSVKAWDLPEINDKKLLKFLNKWGSVGFQNQFNFIRLSQSQTNSGIASALGYPILGEEADLLIGKNFGDRAEQIRQLNEIPLPWIEEELRTLAFILRLAKNLLVDNQMKNKLKHEEILLNYKTRKRIISSNPAYAVLAFNDKEDPAKGSLNASEWQMKFQEVPVLDRAEEVIDAFAWNLNRYLRPLTVGVIRREKVRAFYLRNIAFETAFASRILEILRKSFASLICAECQVPFFPNRDQNNRKYCGDTCNRRVKDRNYKKRKREELSASIPKQKTKQGKEKNGNSKAK